MKCEKCKKDVTHLVDEMCIPCYIDDNLPTRVKDTRWLIAESYERREEAKGKVNCDFDEKLASAMNSAIEEGSITIEKNRNEISIRAKDEVISISITTEGIDSLAQKTGFLVGKWLICRMESEIDSAWKVVAENTWNGNLGISAKVSTGLRKTKMYVICVYTYNFLDLVDVKRVREKLRTFYFNEELCYKPDIYSYLGIYYRKASLSPCRYRI